MIISLDPLKLLHFVLLLGLTYSGGKLVIAVLDWPPMVSFSVACACVIQVNNAIFFKVRSDNDTAESPADGETKKED